jgi:hypothetical protein
MTLRHLTPAFALLIAASVPAAEHSTLTLGGFADVIGTFNDDNGKETSAHAENVEEPQLRTLGLAGLRGTWQPTNDLSGAVNLWFTPYSTDDEGWESGTALREAYIAWHFAPDLTWTFGKRIGHIGLIAQDPTGLYRVNASTIGYLGAYGMDTGNGIGFTSCGAVDPLGSSIAWAPEGSPFSAELFLVNGFFSDYSNGNFADRHGNGLDVGLGADLIWVPSSDLRLNLDLAWDRSYQPFNNSFRSFGIRGGEGAVPGSFTDQGTFGPDTGSGDIGNTVLVVGLNGTWKATQALLLGAEVLSLTAGDAEDDVDGNLNTTDHQRLQGLVMANYALTGATMPMSTTAMIQHIAAENGNGEEGNATEVSLALLTNPLAMRAFALNYEAAYATVATDQHRDADFWGLFVEGLLTF